MGPSKAKAATKQEKTRMARIVELGCVACRINGRAAPTAEIHHLLDGGNRRGHAFSIGLCMWHHRGVPFLLKSLGSDWNVSPLGAIVENTADLGPSLYHDARAFHARYGTDSELLEFQNKLLAEEV